MRSVFPGSGVISSELHLCDIVKKLPYAIYRSATFVRVEDVGQQRETRSVKCCANGRGRIVQIMLVRKRLFRKQRVCFYQLGVQHDGRVLQMPRGWMRSCCNGTWKIMSEVKGVFFSCGSENGKDFQFKFKFQNKDLHNGALSINTMTQPCGTSRTHNHSIIEDSNHQPSCPFTPFIFLTERGKRSSRSDSQKQRLRKMWIQNSWPNNANSSLECYFRCEK